MLKSPQTTTKRPKTTNNKKRRTFKQILAFWNSKLEARDCSILQKYFCSFFRISSNFRNSSPFFCLHFFHSQLCLLRSSSQGQEFLLHALCHRMVVTSYWHFLHNFHFSFALFLILLANHLCFRQSEQQ